MCCRSGVLGTQPGKMEEVAGGLLSDIPLINFVDFQCLEPCFFGQISTGMPSELESSIPLSMGP